MSERILSSERNAERLTLALHGELDMRLAPQLRQSLHRELEKIPPEVVVDLADVPFVDSSIIATLVEALKIVRGRGGKLRIASCRPTVRDTFEIARLLEPFGIA
ncbi:MAG TPA: STAS domain-containing protein [Planctomycetota bacterium]|nr:STAS domain-containing protein [Planctomycetota bacterium]